MFSRIKQKRKLKKVLKNKNLQQALLNASTHHYTKYSKTSKDIPWQELKEKAREIKEECIDNLSNLIQQFIEEAKNTGAQVYQVASPDEALSQIDEIARKKKAKLIVKSKSMVSEEIKLNDFLEKKGYKVVETDLGEWIVQLVKERPSHITAPALHKTKEEVAEILSDHLNIPLPLNSKEIVGIAREKMRKYFIEADIGISGANIAVAESGTLVIVSNEGNARLVTSLPPVHIALLTTEKFVKTLEQASTLIKALTIASSGLKLTSYVSFITGPSKTTDIEKELVFGVHGPQELHIIILDNRRLKIAKDKILKDILYCLKCGGCMLVCPVFQIVGGHIFGGPVYQGGIGILMTAVIRSLEEIYPLFNFCADCKKCEVFCPVGIPTGELILELKSRKGPGLGERAFSAIFNKRIISGGGTRLLSVVQKLWKKDGYLKSLPFPWARGRFLPALNLKKIKPQLEQEGAKVYLFQGCLVKLFFPEIRKSVFATLSHHGFNVVSPPDQVCCGAPSLHLGHTKDVRKLAIKNLKSFENENPDYILTVCPTGNSMLKKTYSQLDDKFSRWTDKIFDFTEFLIVKGCLPERGQSLKKEIFYHYPCHYLNEPRLGAKPKELIRTLGFNLKEEEEPFTCCGFCGIFSFKNPEISSHMWERKKQKIFKNKADIIATDCPGCLFQLKSNLKKENSPLEIFHTAELYSMVLKKNRKKGA
ncbi:MAG: LUD domain-containing protein [Candidatus Aminicenantaceae bacterium]